MESFWLISFNLGSSIPWGVGKLVSKDGANATLQTTTPSSSYSMSPAMSSAAEKNASVQIAVANDATATAPTFILFAFLFIMNYLVFV